MVWGGVGLVVIGSGAFLAMRGRGEVLPEVSIEKAARATLDSKVMANGRIEAQRKVDVSANVMGQIVDLRVDEGDRVEKGDLLLLIDQTQLAASAAVAEASVKALKFDRAAAVASASEAKRSYERTRTSFQQELVPQSEVDRARSGWESAEAQVAAIERRIEQARASVTGAQDSLSKTRILAPISGTVSRLPVEEGEVAVVGTMNNAGTVLMTISDLSVVEAVLEVDETDVPGVKVGQTAKVTIDAYTNRTFEGTVTEIGASPVVKQGGSGADAVDFEVKIQLTEPPESVRPGFSCSAEILTGRREDALSVPIQALVVRDKPADPGAAPGPPQDEEGVYVLDAGAVKFVPIETGITGETRVEVVTGLEEGQQVVTGPFRVLREVKDGGRVREKVETPAGEAAGKAS